LVGVYLLPGIANRFFVHTGSAITWPAVYRFFLSHIMFTRKEVNRVSSCISIGAAHHQELLKNQLDRELRALESRGLKIRLQEKPLGWLTFLDCSISGSGNMETIIRRRVAGIITDLILNNWEATLLKHIIKENYYYFNEDEKSIIYDYSVRQR